MLSPMLARGIRPQITNRHIWISTSCNGAFSLMAFRIFKYEELDFIDQSGTGEFVPVHELLCNRTEVGTVARVGYTYNDDIPTVHEIQRARAELNFILATV